MITDRRLMLTKGGGIAHDDSPPLDVGVRRRSVIRRAVRTWLCVAVFGGHEYYRAWSSTRLFQVCILCGHETHGWDLTR